MLGQAADAKHISVVPTLSRRRRSELGRKSGNTKAQKKVVSDVPALLAAAEDDWRLLLKTAALSGLRLAEVLGLRVRDIEDGTIHVLGQLDRTSRVWVDRTKTPSSKRSVSVPSGLTKELLASVASDADPDSLLFSKGGRGHWAQVAERAFNRAAKKAGLDETLTFHATRHTAASRWIHEGRSVAFVQGQLGHASPSETLNTYTHEWNEVSEGVAAREAADAAYAEATPKPALKLVSA
jgi:integrase